MPKSRTTERPLPGKLDLVFSAFIEVTGLITTGASIARIVSPILACASEILSGKAAFAVLEHKGEFTRISYVYNTRKGRPVIREDQAKLTGRLEKIYNKRRATVTSSVGTARQFEQLTGFDVSQMSGPVITAGLMHRRSKVGTIGVILRKARTPTTEEVGLFELLAREAGVVIKNAREFERTQTLSITDGLTGAYNYRFMLDTIKKEIGRAERFREEFAIIMLDVDGLKEYNDVHGHLGGSGVIKRVAALAAAKLRAIDMLCKYGGDEFVAVLPRTPKRGAALAAERIRRSIEESKFPGERKTGKITMSMGIASFPEDGRTVQDLIERADKALYKAKRHGRNTVWVSGDRTPYSPS
jgi:diguanylate cyclase (GGDEF)-like protein